MRGARASLVVILVVGIAALLTAAKGEDAAGVCAASARCLAARLPAPVTVTTGEVSYRIGRARGVSRIANAHGPYPRNAAWFPATDTWYLVRDRHVVVGRGSMALWRSREQIAADQLGVIAAGPHAVAFQHANMLYLAGYGDTTERPVAQRELPLGWTTGGLFTYFYPRRELLLRSDTGGILATFARRPLEYEYDLHSGNLYFISHGLLLVARGVRAWRLSSLSSLGVSTNTWLQPLGRLIALLGDRRLVVVRHDGSEFASTPLARDGRQADGPSSPLAIAPDASAVAFTVAFGRTDNPNATRRAHGNEIVYLLRADARAAIAIHVEQVAFAPCEREAGLQWRGSWLLYSNTEGNLAAIDTTGAHRAIELGGLARGLLGAGHVIDATWSR
jgi:hypothetical protein